MVGREEASTNGRGASRADPAPRGPLLRLVCFKIRDQELALPIAAVRETIKLRPITRVFLTPPWLVGIFSLRGEIVPAIDVAPWFGMPPATPTDESRLIVLRHASKPFAILADVLAELRSIDAEDLCDPPPTLPPEQAALLSGIVSTATGVVRIVDPEALLASDWMAGLEKPGVS